MAVACRGRASGMRGACRWHAVPAPLACMRRADSARKFWRLCLSVVSLGHGSRHSVTSATLPPMPPESKGAMGLVRCHAMTRPWCLVGTAPEARRGRYPRIETRICQFWRWLPQSLSQGIDISRLV